MTNYTTINSAISGGKTMAINLAATIITNDSEGDDNCCKELQLVVLTRWISILEGYVDENFNSDGTDKVASFPCLTLDQALLLCSKVNTFAQC